MLLIKQPRIWKEKYVLGTSTLFMTVKLYSLAYFDDHLRNHSRLIPQRNSDCISEIEDISQLVKKDLQNAKDCVSYLQEKFPFVNIVQVDYGYAIEGLTDDQIFDCAEHKHLVFDIWFDND